MNRLLFDEGGRFIGVNNPEGSIEQEFNRNTDNSLMTSKELTFLDKEEIIKQHSDSTYWSLYLDGTKLGPLKYSNGKTQEDVVREVTDLIRQGRKIIFVHGGCGTGKSAIALNIARILGRASIVVPIKNLQRQYEEDYTKKKYVIKQNGVKMKIASITGRDNHDSIIFPGVSCADPFLPDTILITEKNRDKILKYYNQNPFIQNKGISDVKRLKRISIAPSNPYWSPIRAAKYELNQLLDAKKKYYKGVGEDYIFYHRREGCSYYDQFEAYLYADVMIFNSAKYEIEMAIGRKPETEIDIIDEADDFLDNFSKNDSFNVTRFLHSLQNIALEYPEYGELEKIKELLSYEIKNKTALGIDEHHIFQLKDTIIGKVLKLLLEKKAIQNEILLDEGHYANKVLQIAFMFADVFDDAYVTYNKGEDEGLYANLVTTNVAKRFAELCEKTKTLVLMSGTLHSEDVLKNVFGIRDFAVVEAETKMPGKIDIVELKCEFDCNYKNLKSKRKEYLSALSSCVENAKKPALVHVNSFADLPTEPEINEYNIANIISREKLKSLQTEDKNGEMVYKFKTKLIDILFTTKCSRGVDFPGDICNSIVFTKYPNPNTQDIFWKILKRTHPIYFWKVYKDKAQREFFQRLYRALRSNEDHVYVLSPDLRVINALKKGI